MVQSELSVPTGDSRLGISFARNSRTTGVMSISIDGQPAGSAELPFMMRMISSLGSASILGSDPEMDG